MRRPACGIRRRKPCKRLRTHRRMRNMLSAAMWNLHGKVCGKPCRNVEKRVPHRWNLVELPLQAAGSSYPSGKGNAVRVIRRSPRTENSNSCAPRERPTVPKQQKAEPEKPSAPQNRPRSERIEPTPRPREDRPTVKDKPQTAAADRKPDRPAERPTVPDKSANTTHNAERTGRRNLWRGVQTAENQKNYAQTAALREPR